MLLVQILQEKREKTGVGANTIGLLWSGDIF